MYCVFIIREITLVFRHFLFNNMLIYKINLGGYNTIRYVTGIL